MTVENTSLEGQRRAPAGSLPAAPQTAVPVGSSQQAAQTASVPQPPAAPLPLSPRPDDEKGHPSIPFPIKIFIASLIILLVLGSFIFLFSHLMAGGSSKVKLTYWGLWEDSNVMQSVISDFERQNPNITVEYVKQDPKQYSERLLARIQNGTGPDIFRFHNTWVPMLRGVLAPLTRETMTSQDFSKSFFPVAKIDLIKNGAILGIPLEIDTLSLFANTDLLQKEKLSVPTTWPDFISVSRAITTRDINGKIKIAGAALGAYDNITHAPDIVSLLLVQNGANVNDLGSTAQNASDAVTFYTSFTKNDGNVWDTTLDPSIKAFANGNLGLYFGYSWDVYSIKAINPNLNFSINPVPHLPGRNMTIASYWVEGVSNRSKHQAEAMLFMKFLAQKDTAQQLYSEEAKTRDFGEPFARPDLADTLSKTILAPIEEQAPSAVSTPFVGETQDSLFNGQLNGYLANTIRFALGNTSVDSALDTLTKGVAQVQLQYAPK